jgi:hypothetical protein
MVIFDGGVAGWGGPVRVCGFGLDRGGGCCSASCPSVFFLGSGMELWRWCRVVARMFAVRTAVLVFAGGGRVRCNPGKSCGSPGPFVGGGSARRSGGRGTAPTRGFLWHKNPNPCHGELSALMRGGMGREMARTKFLYDKNPNPCHGCWTAVSAGRKTSTLATGTKYDPRRRCPLWLGLIRREHKRAHGAAYQVRMAPRARLWTGGDRRAAASLSRGGPMVTSLCVDRAERAPWLGGGFAATTCPSLRFRIPR